MWCKIATGENKRFGHLVLASLGKDGILAVIQSGILDDFPNLHLAFRRQPMLPVLIFQTLNDLRAN